MYLDVTKRYSMAERKGFFKNININTTIEYPTKRNISFFLLHFYFTKKYTIKNIKQSKYSWDILKLEDRGSDRN